MATGPRYTVKLRRRNQGKTNYHTRLALLKSGEHRLVIRKTNKYITCQIVDYNQNGDKIIASAHSMKLIKMGWKHNTRNIPAAYLTGYALGKAAIKAKTKTAIVDMGLYTSTKGSVLYAALKGAVEAGMNIPHNPENPLGRACTPIYPIYPICTWFCSDNTRKMSNE